MNRNIKNCDNCGSEVSLSNYKRHYLSKSCLKGGKYIPNCSLHCSYCNKDFSTSTGRGLHEIQCKNNSKRIISSPNLGRKAWNAGHRSKPDTRNPEFIGKIGGYRPNAGRSKKFKVLDSYGIEVVLQSSYELLCSEILNDLNIKWIRPKSLKYDGRNYFADFYLPEYDIYLDPKNDFKAKQDLEKIQKVTEQNNVQVYIVLKENLNKQWFCSLTGKTLD